jgi:Flp pilus assembly protein TadG
MAATYIHKSIDAQCGTWSRRFAAMRAARADERGAALVEFALVLPVLLLVLFGIIQFGLALNSANDQTHLANEVARYATVNENPGEAEKASLQAWAKKQADQNARNNGVVICISFPNGSEIGAPVKVEVTSIVKWLPVLKLSKVGSTSVTGTAYMRLEAPPTTYGTGCG